MCSKYYRLSLTGSSHDFTGVVSDLLSLRLHKHTHYYLLSSEHLRCDAAFNVCFPEAKVIEDCFIQHFIGFFSFFSFLFFKTNFQKHTTYCTIVEVGINLGNVKLSLILFVEALSFVGEVTNPTAAYP